METNSKIAAANVVLSSIGESGQSPDIERIVKNAGILGLSNNATLSSDIRYALKGELGADSTYGFTSNISSKVKKITSTSP